MTLFQMGQIFFVFLVLYIQNFIHIAFRKLFHGYSNNDKILIITQTKWLIDFISDKLESDDSDLIKSTLLQISNTVTQSLAIIKTYFTLFMENVFL